MIYPSAYGASFERTNTPDQFTAPGEKDIIAPFDPQRARALIQQRAKTMTAITGNPQKSLTIASLSAMAMLVSVTAGIVSNLPASDPAWRAPTQISRAQMIVREQQPQLRADTRDQLGALEASGLVRCIMPPAWQKDCKVSTIKVASN